jgi:pilus assembly protein CpaB
MRRGRIFFYIAFILIIVVVAAFVVWQNYLQPPSEIAQVDGGPTLAQPDIDLVDIVVVTQRAPRGTMLNETMLGMIQIPRDTLIEGMFVDMGNVVERRAKFDLDSGIPLTASMLVDSAEQLSARGSIAALSIPRGKVAISIPISRLSSISYAPRPGDHVSVIATIMIIDVDSEFQSALPNNVAGINGPFVDIESGTSRLTIEVVGGDGAFQGRTDLDPILNELVYVVPSEAQRARLVSQTILGDVEVLQVGDFPLVDDVASTDDSVDGVQQQEGDGGVVSLPAPPEAEPADELATIEKVAPPDIITLIVDPQSAVTINYLLYSGAELTLALRAAGDTTIVSTEATTLQFLLDVYNIPIPAKLPYSLTPRIDELQAPNLEGDQVVDESGQ